MDNPRPYSKYSMGELETSLFYCQKKLETEDRPHVRENLYKRMNRIKTEIMLRPGILLRALKKETNDNPGVFRCPVCRLRFKKEKEYLLHFEKCKEREMEKRRKAMKENPGNLKHIDIIKVGPFGDKSLKIVYRLKKGHPFVRAEEVISILEAKHPDYRFSQHYGSKGEYVAILKKRGVRRNIRENPAPRLKEPIRVDVWEERDRLVITAYDALDREIATWSDDEAREMFEDGFFRTRDVEGSVAEYIRQRGMRPRRKDVGVKRPRLPKGLPSDDEIRSLIRAGAKQHEDGKWYFHMGPSPDGEYEDSWGDFGGTHWSIESLVNLGLFRVKTHGMNRIVWPEKKNPEIQKGGVHVDIHSHNPGLSRKALYDFAARLGLHVDSYSPGDGVTRHRVFTEKTDYFAGDGIFTALGLKELEIFLRGFERAYHGRQTFKSFQKNPPAGMTEVYRDILEIRAVKKDGKRYVHKFKKGSNIFGLPDGSILIRNRRGKKLWKNFK